MCAISVIGLDIIGTFKGKEAIPYLYVYICVIYISCFYIFRISNKKTPFSHF